MTVISVLELRLKPELVGSADDVLRDTLNDTRARPGCLGVEVAIDVDDPAHIVVVETWESLEADDDYRAWRASPDGASSLGSVIAAPPLLSRSLLLTLEQLTDDDLGVLLDRAVTDARGLAGKVTLDPEARAAIIRMASGDARRALTALEASAATALAATDPDDDEDDDSGVDTVELEPPLITPEILEQSVDRALLRYDRNGDEHYDVISAFIKSVRGSDVDAALHYLARMFEAGEDPRFIARRVIILASEDIGIADPQALPIAVAAAEAVQMIGMPEGRIPLAEAVVYLATAPKSNASYMGINAAIADVKAGRFGRVPKHLRDAHYAGAKRLGHGKGYKYPHDDALGVVRQEYLPDELRGTTYYTPTDHGHEREVSARLAKLRDITRGKQN